MIVDGIGCRAGPDSCIMLFSNVTSIVLVDCLVEWLPGMSGSV